MGQGGEVFRREGGLGWQPLWTTFKERIGDSKAANGAAVLHIFAIENVAAGLDGGGDDQGIVERQPVILSERARRCVQVECEREWRFNQRQHIGDCLADFMPFFFLLAPRDGRELIEHLHAELAAACQQRARPSGLPADLLGIHQNISIEESAHRSLASSRSKRYPSGSVQPRAAIRSRALRRWSSLVSTSMVPSLAATTCN